VEELHHGIDLVVIFGHREARDFGLEGLEPRRADGQVDALALDLGRLGNGPLDFAQLRLIIAEPASRAFALHERVAHRQADAGCFEHDAAGLEFILHVQDRGLDLVKVEPFAQHVDQIELAAEDAPGGADRERGGFRVDDGRIPALDDCFEPGRQRLIALKMLELYKSSAGRRRPLQDLCVVLRLAEIEGELIERVAVEPLGTE
jgi:hypothetical protein